MALVLARICDDSFHVMQEISQLFIRDKVPLVPCLWFFTQWTLDRVYFVRPNYLRQTFIDARPAKGALAHRTYVRIPQVSPHISFIGLAAHYTSMPIDHPVHLSMVVDTTCIHFVPL
jgi:hypothetical protein